MSNDASIPSPRRRRIVILGCTGSIGQSALKVATDIPERMEVVGLAALRSVQLFVEQVRAWQPLVATLADSTAAAEARVRLAEHGVGPEILEGEAGLCALATLPEADLVLIAIVGTAGLRPAPVRPRDCGRHQAIIRCLAAT
ncbi:MAG: hypothetical protein EBR81_12640, partial [Proteobacteria bacterium]|nr:hypothetical protein [Pseudomonadota bacterium]